MSQAALFWNPRFAGEQYAYGNAPNDFLKEQAPRLAAGSRVLSLGEGEGRNAVYLAALGHQLTAVDAAHTGLIKLLQRAAQQNLSITATLADLADYPIAP
ncbi:MAG: methyltransferase domain-containing protein, partial [Vogesella sp.]